MKIDFRDCARLEIDSKIVGMMYKYNLIPWPMPKSTTDRPTYSLDMQLADFIDLVETLNHNRNGANK